MKASLLLVSFSAFVMTACANFDQKPVDTDERSGPASMTSAHSGTKEDQDMSPATPLEFAQRYIEFTENLDAASINTLVSDQMTLIRSNGSPQKTYSRSEQLVALTEIYKIEKDAGKKLRAADYTITQHSNDFAILKFTWEVYDPAEDSIAYAHTSYIIRREKNGWRLVFVMELAPGFGGSRQASFSED